MSKIFQQFGSHVSKPGIVFAGLALMLFTGGATSFSQETRGKILGTVHDVSGGVVPGAKVVVTNTATNVSSKGTSNDSGALEATYLDPGTYNVEVSAAG